MKRNRLPEDESSWISSQVHVKSISMLSGKNISETKPVKVESAKRIDLDNPYLRRTIWIKFLLLSVDNIVWKCLQIYAVIVRFIIATYTITFLPHHAFHYPLFFTNKFLDLFFFINLVSAIAYRVKWPSDKKPLKKSSPQLSKLVWRNFSYRPLPIWMLVLDAITLIPLDAVNYYLTKESEFVHTLLHCSPIFRIYKLPFFYERLTRISLKNNEITEIIFKFSVFWLILSHTIVCFWRWFTDEHPSDFSNLVMETKSLDMNNLYDWYFVIFYFVQISMSNIGFGDVTPTTDSERVITAVIIFVGFLVLNGYLISDLSNVLKEQVRRVTILRLRLSLMEAELVQRKVPKKGITRILKFYHSLWNSRKGVGPSNSMLSSLPDSLSSQVYFDIYGPVLDASLLFRSCDEFSKRAIAKVMQMDLYMAGDVIMKRNEIISKMLYVRKGTVQIMSYQDDETEIMTFGAGSFFGQYALLLSLPAKSEVHAATFCEIYLIDRRNLFIVLTDYPKAKEIIRNVHRVNVENILLNALADKFKTRSRTSVETSPQNLLNVSNFYKVPLEATRLSRNDICLVSTCPYVFEPDTVFINSWHVLVAIVIMGLHTFQVISIYYPYCAAFSRQYPINKEPFIVFIDIILILNMYLSFSTAYVKENILFSSLRDIIASNLTKFTTYIDVIALMPFHYFLHSNIRLKPVILCLRCLLFYKIHLLFFKAEESVNTKMVAVLRLIKYVLYFFFGGYVVGMFYYMEACYVDPCDTESWYEHLVFANQTSSPIWVSLYFAISVISGTGFGDIYARNKKDVLFVIVFCVGGVFLFAYLIAEYSANLSLTGEPRENFMSLTDTVYLTLMNYKMLQSERIRVRQFLNLQWERNMGYEFTFNQDLFHDTPQHLLYEISQYTRSRALQNLPIFKGMSEAIINQILTSCTRKIFPPHEVVTYAGDVCNTVIVIEEGYCEIAYGNDVSLKKIISAGDEIGTVELLLGLTTLCHVRTITHCSVLNISKKILQRAFSFNLLTIEELQAVVTDFKSDPIVQKLQKSRPIRLHLVVRSSVQKSFYRFHYYRKESGNEELRRPFLKLGLCQWIRFVIGPITILPYGNFLKIWEVSRCFFALFSSLLFPLLPYFELQVRSLIYLAFMLDASAWIDLYLRLHVCYYNDKSLLVSHPLNTWSHYFKGSFALDFIFCFPFDRIMFRPVFDTDGYALVTYQTIDFLRFLRIGQVYRIPTTVLNLGSDFLSVPSFFSIMLMMIALTMVFLNFLTSALVLLCINYKSSLDGKYKIVIYPTAEIHFEKLQSRFNLTKEPFHVYLLNFYWICITSFGVGFGDITAETNTLRIYMVFVIIFSYLFLNYVTIVVASYLSSINVNLTVFQKKMTQLIKYLKAENIEPLLRKHIVNHFELVWRKQKGVKARVVFERFNLALEGDIMLCLYENTLKGVEAFANADQSFFRILSDKLEEIHFQMGAAIHKPGDIIPNVYIIHQGEVTLVGDNENHTSVLGPSKLFGHLENTPNGIVEISAVATKNVTILSIETIMLYKILEEHIETSAEGTKEYVDVRELMMKSAQENLEGLQENKFKATQSENTLARLTFWLSKPLMIANLVLSLFSANQVSYNLAFYPYTVPLYIVLILIEILFIIKIFLRFSTGYFNEAGEFVSDYHLIKARYVKIAEFYIDIITVIPFEILALVFPKKDQGHAMAWFRMTKILRVYNIWRFFNIKFDTINLNVVLLKTIAVAIWAGTLLHQCTCLWYLISCPQSDCPRSKTWRNILDGDFQNRYISSLYSIVVVITTTGFGDTTPFTTIEIIYVIILVIIGFFYTAIFIGQIISTTQKTLYAKTNFEYEVEGMKTYLYVNDVPQDTQKKILRYVKNLWRNEKGHQRPELLKDAPYYINRELKFTSYGHHINNHPVFQFCNPIFKKQLIRNLYRCVYFPGDIIVFEGEVNRTVYFVHSGLVEGRDIANENVKIYEQNTFFGLKQGVNQQEPHTKTYTAITYCIILYLELKRWSFLSSFFPEDIMNVKKSSKENDWD